MFNNVKWSQSSNKIENATTHSAESIILHFVNGRPLNVPLEKNQEEIIFGMGCFWGAEKLFWQTKGIITTAVGYIGGNSKNPSYEEVCSGLSGHNEVVKVRFEPKMIMIDKLIQIFWENHDPTQGMRQGNDIGTQYRSGIYCLKKEHLKVAKNLSNIYQKELNHSGFGPITTEIGLAKDFFFAEDYHQQYLAKNPSGYCGGGGTGVVFKPIQSE